ncbi:cysteine--tRNA ligase [Candidatus Wolfebacteria bacterium]|nr:cysteine--tRNA ligase [Candidatus Wolfebacteria bacterium]
MKEQSLYLFNTLTKQKEKFLPIKSGWAGMYNCGPTVYDYVHIGNLRAYVFADVLRRTLEWSGYTVRQIINITDVGHLTSDADDGEDKMTKGLRREGLPVTIEAMRELAEKYTRAFEEDISALNILHPTALPRATEHISEQIELIKALEAKGFAYITSDGVYFDTARDPNYGKLGGLSAQAGLSDESFVRADTNSEKKHPRDFALWKFSPELGWGSPWGKGFPGWHIECSAMSMKYLGETFDIHTGGIDHIPIHHNNEIAQSENATNAPLAYYWLHSAFVNFKSAKMAKSAGGFITRKTLEERGFNSVSYRYWLLTAHYRSPLEFTWEALDGAQNALQRLKNRFLELGSGGGAPSQVYLKKFTDFLSDDLNTPQALALVWNFLKNPEISDLDKKATLIEFDKVLGLGLAGIVPTGIPPDVAKLIEKREGARKHDDWQTADELRREIEHLGYSVKDTDTGPRIQKMN